MVPNESPDEEDVAALQKLLDETLAAEFTSRGMACEDPFRRGTGFYIYDAQEQDED